MKVKRSLSILIDAKVCYVILYSCAFCKKQLGTQIDLNYFSLFKQIFFKSLIFIEVSTIKLRLCKFSCY